MDSGGGIQICGLGHDYQGVDDQCHLHQENYKPNLTKFVVAITNG